MKKYRRWNLRSKQKKKDLHYGDKIFYWILKILAFGIIFLLLAFFILLFVESLPALKNSGWSFFWKQEWNPVTKEFGALAFIFGTLATSIVALIISIPVSVGSALLITEIAGNRSKNILGFLIEMLAAIPSVVYGLWGLFILVPILREQVEPFFKSHFGFLPIFQGAPIGVGILAASLVLAIMITPTITSISREVFSTIPKIYKEGALALGATKWEMIKLSVIKSSTSGILGASILGLGRALGETMAVTMVIGNRNQIASSLFSPAQTMASLIVNEYSEASQKLHSSALMAVGLTLFIVSLVMNICARFIVWRVDKRYRGSR